MIDRIKKIINRSEVSEKAIEAYLVSRCKESKLACLKYSNQGVIGYPDRLVLLPGGKVVWVELKSKGAHASAIQIIRHRQLEGLGHKVRIIDSRLGVDLLMFDIANGNI